MRGSGIVKNWQVDRCNVPRDTGRVRRELVGESVVPLAPAGSTAFAARPETT